MKKISFLELICLFASKLLKKRTDHSNLQKNDTQEQRLRYEPVILFHHSLVMSWHGTD